MSELIRKDKMISLRLSQAEYESLRSLYPSYGARNISDFARLAMQRVITKSLGAEDALLARMHELDGRLKTVESRLASLEREKVLL
jgi:hypothetical protein